MICFFIMRFILKNKIEGQKIIRSEQMKVSPGIRFDGNIRSTIYCNYCHLPNF